MIKKTKGLDFITIGCNIIKSKNKPSKNSRKKLSLMTCHKLTLGIHFYISALI